MAFETEEILREGQIDRYADILKLHWEAKQKLSDQITSGRINQLYRLAMENGAAAGKIIGAGGGGYLLIYCPDQEKRDQIRMQMAKAGIDELRYSFDFTGVNVLVDDGARSKHTDFALI